MVPLRGCHRAGAYAVSTSLMPVVVKFLSPLDVQGRVAKDNPKRTIQEPFLLPKGPPALLPQMAPLPLKFEGVPLLTTIGRELVICTCKVTAVNQNIDTRHQTSGWRSYESNNLGNL